MSKGIDGILEDLVKERDQMLGQIRAMENTLQNLRDEVQRIDSSLATLRGEAKPRSTSPRGGGASSKPKPAFEEVRAIVANILSKGPMDEPEIKDALFKELDEKNRKKNGVHNTLRKLLRDEYRFDGLHWSVKA